MTISAMLELKGKVAIVTGAHAWLGYDIACVLAEAGCDVIVTSRDKARALNTAGRITKQYSVDALGLTMDQRYHEQVRAMAQQAQAWKGHIDILVNNAGGGSGKSAGSILDRDPEHEAELIGTTGTITVEFAHWDRCTVSVYERSSGRWKQEELTTERDEMFRREDREFLQAVASGTPVSCPLSEAVKSQKIISLASGPRRTINID